MFSHVFVLSCCKSKTLFSWLFLHELFSFLHAITSVSQFFGRPSNVILLVLPNRICFTKKVPFWALLRNILLFSLIKIWKHRILNKAWWAWRTLLSARELHMEPRNKKLCYSLLLEVLVKTDSIFLFYNDAVFGEMQ